MTNGELVLDTLEPDSDRSDLGERLAAETEEWLDKLPSPATRRGYARDLGIRLPVAHPEKGPARSPLLGGCAWLDWVRVRAPNPLVVRESEVIRWLRALEEAGYSAATRARALAAVRAWYRRLERAGLVDRSPAAGVSAGAQGIHPPTDTPTIVLSAEHAAAMIEAAHNMPGPMRLRHAATVALLLVTGVRVGELVGLAVQDLTDRQGAPLLRVRGKGGKYRRMALADIARARVQAYLASRADLKILVLHGKAGARARIPLLMTRTGKPISTFEVFRLLRRLAVAAGLPKEVIARLTPHVTRHTTAAFALESGANVEQIRQLLGHASITTTQRYLHSSGELLPHGVGAVLAAAMPAGA